MAKRPLYRYFLATGVIAHLAALTGLVVLYPALETHGLGGLIAKFRQHYGQQHPALTRAAVRALSALNIPTRRQQPRVSLPPFPGPDRWPRHGAIPQGLGAQHYDERGVPLQSAIGGEAPMGVARTVIVDDAKSLLEAIKRARPGDAITLRPGTYQVRGRRISLGAAGTATAPVYVRAERFGDVTLELDMLEGFFVDQAYWIFENLRIHGSCTSDSRCEHAFHVFGTALGTVLRNNELVDFNAALKVNGNRRKGREDFPDFGLVQNNSVYNSRPRRTGNPVTPLNINSGNGWVVSANFIADFSKARGNRISYAAFMKGNSQGGVFERNLVVCHWRLPPEGDIRLGLSFGGGGTGARFCRGGDCSTEHTAGTIRNNIIARCPADVGIYVNKGAQTRIHNNLLIASLGIDIRFSTSSASIHNNVIDGRILDRDGGTHIADHNLGRAACGLLSRLLGGCNPAAWYQAPLAGDFRLNDAGPVRDRGNVNPESGLDFCGNRRAARPDIGPIEYGDPIDCLPR